MAYYTNDELNEFGLHYYGNNVKISNKSSIYGAENISLGNNVRIDDFCILSAGHGGISIGSFVHIGAHTSLIGEARIEVSDYANLSGRVSIYSNNDDYSGEWMTNPTIHSEFTGVTHAPVTIGRHAIIGAGSVLLPGTILEEGVAVGALSLIKGCCQKFGIYGGIPAKRLAERKNYFVELERMFLDFIKNG